MHVKALHKKIKTLIKVEAFYILFLEMQSAPHTNPNFLYLLVISYVIILLIKLPLEQQGSFGFLNPLKTTAVVWDVQNVLVL